eukprot:354135-Chlamydomonas_euryale.AAC.6
MQCHARRMSAFCVKPSFYPVSLHTKLRRAHHKAVLDETFGWRDALAPTGCHAPWPWPFGRSASARAVCMPSVPCKAECMYTTACNVMACVSECHAFVACPATQRTGGGGGHGPHDSPRMAHLHAGSAGAGAFRGAPSPPRARRSRARRARHPALASLANRAAQAAGAAGQAQTPRRAKHGVCGDHTPPPWRSVSAPASRAGFAQMHDWRVRRGAQAPRLAGVDPGAPFMPTVLRLHRGKMPHIDVRLHLPLTNRCPSSQENSTFHIQVCKHCMPAL